MQWAQKKKRKETPTSVDERGKEGKERKHPRAVMYGVSEPPQDPTRVKQKSDGQPPLISQHHPVHFLFSTVTAKKKNEETTQSKIHTCVAFMSLRAPQPSTK
jgi:hypothetical protein